jgi:putative membrane protein insertion efficiency factor
MQFKILSFFKKTISTLETMLLFPLVVLIRIYQKFFSFLLIPSCRFYPSCSSYSLQAIRVYGILGFYYIFLRMIRCQPLCKGGYDPLPKKKNG